ncbi:MAG: hypothetical protein OSA97_19805, partial [Nevskia sp.]|nr:hypothetical protein [Nevskia sp.]
SDQDRAAILKRIAFSCNEDLSDPTASGKSLAFPVQLQPATAGAVVWHRYACVLTINYRGTLGQTINYTSPRYAVNQLDVSYGTVNVEPAVAFQNYNLGSLGAPSYSWLGRYVQPLNLMLRDKADAMPANAIAGVNGGYDYRVDAWAQNFPHDNICLPRYSTAGDKYKFYNHPPPVQCPMAADGLPSCAQGGNLPWTDDMGDTLIYLTQSQRAKSWRTTPFQSYSCGGVNEANDRGALILYPSGADARRTSPGKDDVGQLQSVAAEAADSALGAGPLLIQDGHFVYDQVQSEEGMPLDNYEIGGATGAGFQRNSNGTLTLHIVNIDGQDNQVGLHDWMLGLYFLSPYAASTGAVALGNGGDATLWVNPQAPEVQAVLGDSGNPNNAYFKALFVNNSHAGVVSNCSGFTAPPISCSARPVHNGLFVYSH